MTELSSNPIEAPILGSFTPSLPPRIPIISESEPSESISITNDQQQQKDQKSKKKYSVISQQVREKFIKKVLSKQSTIREAAKEFGLKFSTSKAILQTYKREGRIDIRNLNTLGASSFIPLVPLNGLIINNSKMINQEKLDSNEKKILENPINLPIEPNNLDHAISVPSPVSTPVYNFANYNLQKNLINFPSSNFNQIIENQTTHHLQPLNIFTEPKATNKQILDFSSSIARINVINNISSLDKELKFSTKDLENVINRAKSALMNGHSNENHSIFDFSRYRSTFKIAL